MKKKKKKGRNITEPDLKKAMSWMLLPLGTKKRGCKEMGKKETVVFSKNLVEPFDPLSHVKIYKF